MQGTAKSAEQRADAGSARASDLNRQLQQSEEARARGEQLLEANERELKSLAAKLVSCQSVHAGAATPHAAAMGARAGAGVGGSASQVEGSIWERWSRPSAASAGDAAALESAAGGRGNEKAAGARKVAMKRSMAQGTAEWLSEDGEEQYGRCDWEVSALRHKVTSLEKTVARYGQTCQQHVAGSVNAVMRAEHHKRKKSL